MAGKASLLPHDAGMKPVSLLPLSVIVVRAGQAPARPQASGRVPAWRVAARTRVAWGQANPGAVHCVQLAQRNGSTEVLDCAAAAAAASSSPDNWLSPSSNVVSAPHPFWPVHWLGSVPAYACVQPPHWRETARARSHFADPDRLAPSCGT